jgi:WD40 repeat protein
VAWVFDLKTQRETARFANHRGLNGAVLSPDAKWLALCSWHGSGVKVFGVQNGKLALSVPEATNSGAVFSPDGQWLAVGTGREYQLWSVGSWQSGLRIARAETTDMPGPMAFAPDGRILAIVISWPLVRLIDVASDLELATLEAPDVDMIQTLSFSPDGTQLVVGSQSHRLHRLHVWDLRLIRRRLAAMGLDWDLPPFKPNGGEDTPPLRLEIVAN